MARKLLDLGLYNALTASSGLGVGWKLYVYTAGSSTLDTSYNVPTAGSANSNPVIADASGRFDEIWLTVGSSYKYVLTDEDDVVKVTVDNYLVSADAPTINSALLTFLAASAPLPVANGGTASTTAGDAAVALAVLKLAGGTMTGNIVRSGKGIHPYFNNSNMTGGQIYAQASGADPTTNPGDIVFEW